MRRSIDNARPIGILAALALVLGLLAFAGSGAYAAGRDDDRPAVSEPEPATAQAAQTLTWTADNSTTAYKSAPTEAEAGPTTIVFENSKATGNTSGMQHTLTFDTTTEGYNHDVDLDILAYPDDENNGKWSVDVTLTKGTYRFHCTIPGHGQMVGELKVTGGGDPGDDTTPPVANAKIEGEKNDAGAFIGQAKVSVTATDEGGSGVDKVEYQVDDLGWKAYSDPVVVDKVGDHTIGYRATDGAGNKSEEGSKQFKVVKDDGKDTAPPEVSLMLHGDTNNDGAYVGSAELMVDATDSESGVDTVEYKLDDGEWQAYADAVKVNKVGDHTVQARATDKAGNASDAVQKKFTVVEGPDDDTEAPTATAAVQGSQGADWNYIGPVTVKVDATDAGSGVDKIEYKLDDGEWQAYEEPVKVEDEGDHAVDYRATDAAGNTSDAKRVTFTIVSAPPEGPVCAEPDPSPTVVMGSVNSGVRNRDAGGGCTVDDRIHDEARWSTHAGFVAHARRTLADLVEEGTVSAGERTKIIRAAKRSDVGKDGARKR